MQPYRFLLESQTLARFLAIQCLELAVFFAFWYLLFPESLAEEFAHGPLRILYAFLIAHFCWALFEYFLHRYVLHTPVFPRLKIFSEKHNAHHALTYVRRSMDGARVENAYPIIDDAQRAHSIFPWWALSGFFAIATPILFALDALVPQLPMFLGGYLAAFATYVGYEVLHAYEHRSYELWWRPRIERRVSGRLWRSIYAFHLTHHAAPRSNEGISGFFGIPVPDLLFGTYKRSSVLLIDGAEAITSDFKAPRGYLVIRTLDRILGVRDLP
jgi:hemolysin III